MAPEARFLGIDIGSVSICTVLLDQEKKIRATGYRFHHGKIHDALERQIRDLTASPISAIAATSSTPGWINADIRYDTQVSLIAAARHFHKTFRSILFVGGEKFGLIEFDEKGNYSNCRSNSACAAGTGSFLDQQAGRLNLSGIEELSRIANTNTGAVPKIASRCAVFAKTDLIHAQNVGYSFAEISEGLCQGLAKNIVDTVFGSRKTVSPVVFCGGVSKNSAVIKHICRLAHITLLQDEYAHLYGAMGAALNYIEELKSQEPDRLTDALEAHSNSLSMATLVRPRPKNKRFYFDELNIKLSTYPEFGNLTAHRHQVKFNAALSPVEVDLYKDVKNGSRHTAFLGIDIGSTSTKAVLMDHHKTVLAGFYTRTSGRPVAAIQSIFEAIDTFMAKKNLGIHIISSGTTGSGRKFIRKIVGAAMAVDEITAHARAAYEINPDVDTIIEIGGQDSKFTTLQNGRVTSAVMNNVCAAGTGSFIEEQALKLGVALSTYSERTLNQKAPLSSDRCTVFMERDINHYLNEGYSVNEVLASALHSVRENYLLKVATEKNIGQVICFQGATAKNKALVAAFEQRLKKPIHVSKYCHLTGALGTALILHDEQIRDTKFRGFSLYKREIPIHSEICELCTNHCKITIADMGDEKEAYGFLCGRDYQTQNRVSNNTSGFDLIKERKGVLGITRKSPVKDGPVIGIPAALYMFEDLPFWQKFFEPLSVRTVTSATYPNAVRDGKNISQAEFCAPVSAMHGHVHHLLKTADYVFLPFYLDSQKREKGVMRQYCYYSQYVPAVVASANGEENKILSPVIKYIYSQFHTKVELYKTLKPVLGSRINFLEIASAYDKALAFKASGLHKLKALYQKASLNRKDIRVVFLGRPYTILSSFENKGIPDIFAALGIRTFYQDMLSYGEKDTAPISPLLNEMHWHYASKIMAAAQVISDTDGVYPVFITSFKCAPDSFTLEYFKKLMHLKEKPYLILELDDHGSSVGYETRIEAAVRAFKNHSVQKKEKPIPSYHVVNPRVKAAYGNKTVLIPNWDPMTCSLLASNLKREGVDAMVLEETEASIQKGVKYNTGQCIPINAITQAFVDTVETNHLNPEHTVLWMFKSGVCSLKLFPHHINHLLQSYGNGMEKAGVCSGEISFSDISVRAALNTYFAFMFGGLLRKMACKIRPYEINKGETDAAVAHSLTLLNKAFLGTLTKEEAVCDMGSLFKNIRTKPENRPKVAIFGDIYVRDNDVMNQGLVGFIEQNGGEVVTTPYHQYCKMIAGAYFHKWFKEGNYRGLISYKALLAIASRMEKTYYKYFEPVLKEPDFEFDRPPASVYANHHLAMENTGEAMESVLKTYFIKKHYPDVSLFVQTSPAFCCPSLVTESMQDVIEKNTGVPVVSVTYDGTGGFKNDVIVPFLKFPRNIAPVSVPMQKYGNT